MAQICKVVLSDLHLGAGRFSEGNLLEDFEQDETFCGLLRSFVRESERHDIPMELILAGDTFEFLQVPFLAPDQDFEPQVSYDLDLYEASSESASLSKLMLIAEGHVGFFAGLSAFLNSSAPRRTVTFIKGNHDVNLHWPLVQEAIRSLLGEEGDLADCVAFEERYISREGLYIEHGNQYAEGVSKFPDFEQPHDPEAAGELYMPVGSRWVTRIFNEMERKRYWLDGIKPATALIWYLFALDFEFAVEALRLMLREMPSLISTEVTPDWNLMSSLEALQELLNDLNDKERMAQVARRLPDRSPFYVTVDRVLSLYNGVFVPDPLAHDTDGYEALPYAVRAERRVRDGLREEAARKKKEEGADVVVFGHSHQPVAETLENGVRYFNAGTWTWNHSFPTTDLATWRRLFRHPERFTDQRRLNYVRIDYVDGQIAEAQLLEYLEPNESSTGVLAKIGGWLRWLFGHD